MAWNTYAADLAPMPVVNHAISGTETGDQLFFFDQLVPRSRARLVVWYCGSNDAGRGILFATIMENTNEWIRRTQKALPQARILLVSIIRAPQKRQAGQLVRVDEVNKALGQLAVSIPNVAYVDVNPVLEDAAGEPVMDCYVADKLHFTPEGYRRMTSILKPAMEKNWKPASAANTSTKPK